MELSLIPAVERVCIGMILIGSLRQLQVKKHYTVCITYQTITEERSMDQEPDDDKNLSSGEETCFTREVTEVTRFFIRRKDVKHSSQVLYIFFNIGKKLKLRTSDFLFNDNLKRLHFENTSASMNNWKIDILWMLNYQINLHNLTPLWSGWNSKLIEPMQYTQKVWYLPQINKFQTNHSTLAETLRRSLQIAQEAKKKKIVLL